MLKRLMIAVLSATLVLGMSVTALADDESVDTDEAYVAESMILAAEPTEEQDAVIREILPNIIYRYLNQDVSFADISNDDIVEFLYVFMNDAYSSDSAIVTYTGYTSEETYPYAFDKTSALKNVGDIFGRTITEDDINALNAGRSRDLFKLTDDSICINGADGEGVSIPDLVIYSVDGENLVATVLFTTYYNDDSEIPGCAVITFVTNPDSFFGYSLVSLVSV